MSHWFQQSTVHGIAAKTIGHSAVIAAGCTLQQGCTTRALLLQHLEAAPWGSGRKCLEWHYTNCHFSARWSCSISIIYQGNFRVFFFLYIYIIPSCSYEFQSFSSSLRKPDALWYLGDKQNFTTPARILTAVGAVSAGPALLSKQGTNLSLSQPQTGKFGFTIIPGRSSWGTCTFKYKWTQLTAMLFSIAAVLELDI